MLDTRAYHELFQVDGCVPNELTIPPAEQEAGLRMVMYLLVDNIQQYKSEHGRLPDDLQDVGDSPDAVRYVALTRDVFRLRGQTGDVTVEFTSTEPLDHLLDDATMAIVSGLAPSIPGGAPAI